MSNFPPQFRILFPTRARLVRCTYNNQYISIFCLAVIFVIDSTNSERLSEAHDELAKLLDEKRLKDALILIYANKQVRQRLVIGLCYTWK